MLKNYLSVGQRFAELTRYGLILLLVNFALSASAVAAEPIKILAFGDSLTAGYNLGPTESFAAKLEAALRRDGETVRVINGGVSGDTTAGGLARIDWALADNPQVAVVELGANDMLRGLDPERTYANLDTILTRLRQKNVKVLLAGMVAMQNLGPDYAKAFNGIYGRLAKKHAVPLYPFFLDGVASRRELNLPDGMHPNAEGVDVIVRNILPHVKALLKGTT